MRFIVMTILWLMVALLSGFSWAGESLKKVYLERNQDPSLSQKIGDLVKDSVKTGFNYLLEQFGEEAIPEDQVEYIYFDRVPNSPYVIADDDLYWERKVVRIQTCTFCTRSNVTSTSYEEIYYELVDGDFDLENLVGIHPSIEFITDYQHVVYGNKVILEAKISADFNPTNYRLEHVRDAFLIVDDLVFLKDQYLPINGREFEYIADHLYKDAQYVYNNGTMLEDADPETFEIVNHVFAQDKHRVWINETGFELTDIAPGLVRLDCTIADSKSCRYAKNDHQVFYGKTVIEGADAKTFEMLSLSCPSDPAAFDIPQVECDLEEVQQNDWSCIQRKTALEQQYTDKLFSAKNYPYLQCHIPDWVAKSNANEEWARDKNNIYRYGAIEPRFDVNTTEMIYLSSQLFIIDQKNIVRDHFRDRTTYDNFIAGPLTQDGFANRNDMILADANGFFKFTSIGGQLQSGRAPLFDLCDYTENQDKGLLRVIENPPEGIAYAFEDDLFEYYIRTPFGDKTFVGPRSAAKRAYKKTADILEIKDFMIQKSTGIRYLMFPEYMQQCDRWDSAKANSYYLK